MSFLMSDTSIDPIYSGNQVQMATAMHSEVASEDYAVEDTGGGGYESYSTSNIGGAVPQQDIITDEYHYHEVSGITATTSTPQYTTPTTVLQSNQLSEMGTTVRRTSNAKPARAEVVPISRNSIPPSTNQRDFTRLNSRDRISTNLIDHRTRSISSEAVPDVSQRVSQPFLRSSGSGRATSLFDQPPSGRRITSATIYKPQGLQSPNKMTSYDTSNMYDSTSTFY
jgi:hypothetical protein